MAIAPGDVVGVDEAIWKVNQQTDIHAIIFNEMPAGCIQAIITGEPLPSAFTSEWKSRHGEVRFVPREGEDGFQPEGRFAVLLVRGVM